MLRNRIYLFQAHLVSLIKLITGFKALIRKLLVATLKTRRVLISIVAPARQFRSFRVFALVLAMHANVIGATIVNSSIATQHIHNTSRLLDAKPIRKLPKSVKTVSSCDGASSDYKLRLRNDEFDAEKRN